MAKVSRIPRCLSEATIATNDLEECRDSRYTFHMSPAQHVIDVFGGVVPLCEAAGVRRSTVYRWTWPKSRGGTDGHIPRWHHENILQAAHDRGLSLTAVELVAPPTDEGRAA